MLAEIFFLRLELMLHVAAAKSAAMTRSRFVPIKLPGGFRMVRGRA